MNKKTVALTLEQYKEIISTMQKGFTGLKPNRRIAAALQLEANLGLRISDIVRLRPCDIVKDGDRRHLEIKEKKTGKSRVFTVPDKTMIFISEYCRENKIEDTALMFPITERQVQKQLKIVCDYLDYQGISTHSFRKFFATTMYNKNGHDVALVQKLLQHSTVAVTQRYIGIESERIEQALENHAYFI